MIRLLLLTFTFLIVVFSINAQITITIADAPTIGMVRYQVNDTTPSTTVVHGNAGANQIWNFTGLHTSTLDTMNFVDPTATPYASSFPTATFAVKTKMNDQPAYIYLTKDNTGVYAVGIAGKLSTLINSVLKVTFLPRMSFLRTPSDYLSNYSETYHYTIKTTSPPAYSLYGDSLKVVSWNSSVSNIDSWGSLTTPGGTFNTLRQYERIINHDTIWFRNAGYPLNGGWLPTSFATSIDTNDTYKWWTNTIGSAVADLKMNLHQLKTKSFGYYVAQPTVVEQLSKPSMLSMYPNPATDNVFINNLNASSNYNIKVVDIIGKDVKEIQIENTTKTELSLQGLKNGIYFISVFENNRKLATEKIILNH